MPGEKCTGSNPLKFRPAQIPFSCSSRPFHPFGLNILRQGRSSRRQKTPSRRLAKPRLLQRVEAENASSTSTTPSHSGGMEVVDSRKTAILRLPAPNATALQPRGSPIARPHVSQWPPPAGQATVFSSQSYASRMRMRDCIHGPKALRDNQNNPPSSPASGKPRLSLA